MATFNSSDRIVVAVDFGTTFSGVAAAYSGSPESPDEIQVIKSWPGGSNMTTEKASSEIAYDDEGGEPRWGFQLRPEAERLRCIKLMLDSRQELPNYVSQSDLRDQLERKGKDAPTVVADYLTELWAHAKEVLKRRWSFMDTSQVDVILTVPAVWSDAAKDATLKAAKRAGMGDNITLISEPEAAAVYTLKSMQPAHLRVGHNFIVCDAGGGTVDIIAFEIKQVAPLRVEESAEGDGDCCGAAILNIRFEESVRTKIGAPKFDDLRRRKPRAWQTALKYFEEYVKRNFDPENTTVEFSVPFPVNDGEAPGVEEGFLTLTSADVWKIFEPVINSICRLIESQIHRLQAQGKPINGLILVGGFGQSNCLFKMLKTKFEYLSPPPPYPGTTLGSQNREAFEIMQPNNAWTAVVRGGVLRGLGGTEVVLSRKARRHYGVVCCRPFNPRKHADALKEWDEDEEVWKVDNRMSWFIKKGQTCDSNAPILFPFYRTYAKKENKTAHTRLIFCDLDEAPEEYNAWRGKTRVLCTLETDLSKVPRTYWKQHRTSKGKPYFAIHYKLGMQIKSGSIHFDLRIDGNVYGNVTARFE